MWENRGIMAEHGQQKVSVDRIRLSSGIYETPPGWPVKASDDVKTSKLSASDKFPWLREKFASLSISNCKTADWLALSMFRSRFRLSCHVQGFARPFVAKLTTQLSRFSCCRNLHWKISSLLKTRSPRFALELTSSSLCIFNLKCSSPFCALFYAHDKLFLSQFKCEANFFLLV